MSDEALNERLPEDWLSRGRAAPRHVPTLTEVLELPGDTGVALPQASAVDELESVAVEAPDGAEAALLAPDPSPAPRADPAPWDEDLLDPESSADAALAPLAVDLPGSDAGMAFELRLDLPAEPAPEPALPIDAPADLGLAAERDLPVTLKAEPAHAPVEASQPWMIAEALETGLEQAGDASVAGALSDAELAVPPEMPVLQADKTPDLPALAAASRTQGLGGLADLRAGSVGIPLGADEGAESSALDTLLQEALQRAMPAMVSLLRNEIRALLQEQQGESERASH